MLGMTFLEMGIKAKKTEDGRCVKTMVLTSPIRLDKDEAARFENEDIRFVTLNRVPSIDGSRWCLRVKK